MSASVGNKVRALAADGYFGKQDLEKAVLDMLDGRGITKPEKSRFTSAVEEVFADKSVRVSQAAKDSYGELKERMRGFSQSKQVYAPTLDAEEVRTILSAHIDQTRRTISDAYSDAPHTSTRRSSGGEYSTRRTSGGEYNTSRRTSGGEYSTRRTSGGEYATRRTSGGEYATRRTSGGE